MSTVTIRTKTKEMRSGARDIQAEINVIRNQLSTLKSAVRTLNSYWTGQGHDEFEKKINNDMNEIQQFINEATKYYNDIVAVANSYENSEKNVIAKASKRK